jgi:integrase
MQPRRGKPVRHKPTKVTGIYYSTDAKGRKRFEVRYTDSNGRRVYEVAGTFEAAKARLAEVTGKKVKGEVVANSAATVGELIEGWQTARDVKPSTAATYDAIIRRRVLPRWKNVRVREVTRAAITEWLRGLRREDGREGPLGDGTKRLILAVFSEVMAHAVNAEVILVNPVGTPARRAKPRPTKLLDRILGPGEFEALLEACGKRQWLKDVLVVTLHQALRLGEVLALRWKDVDFGDGNEGRLTVRQAVDKDGSFGTPKGGVAAEIPLMPEARRVLVRLWMAAGRPQDGPVFTNRYGGYLRYRDVQRAFVQVRTRAKLSTEPRAFRFHDLRHSAISRLANAPGAVFPEVQRFARHATLATTLLYVHRIDNAEWAEQAATALAGL